MEEERRTAAAGMEAIGFVGLRLRDLQLWLVQVAHFVLKSGCDLVVG